MNLSVQNMPPLQWPIPLQLLQETKVINHTGQRLDLIVVIYSINGTEFANAQFLPNEEEHFIIPRFVCESPQQSRVSLFCYQREHGNTHLYQRELSFTEFFQNPNYLLGA